MALAVLQRESCHFDAVKDLNLSHSSLSGHFVRYRKT
jgi:hypothetical protein